MDANLVAFDLDTMKGISANALTFCQTGVVNEQTGGYFAGSSKYPLYYVWN
jgi:hypothetical protein